MENSLQRRTQMGFRQAQRWHEALDMRGDYNRLVNAADVPLKCGFSILRRIMLGQVENKGVYSRDDLLREEDAKDVQAWHEFRARLGGASKIAHNSTAIIRRFNLGKSRKNYIADLGLNIAHLTRPGFLVTHLHETGHLLCDLVRVGAIGPDLADKEYRHKFCRECMTGLGRSCFRYQTGSDISERDLEEKERHEEVFAEMFTVGLLWNDVNEADFATTYLRFYLGMFFINERGMSTRSDIALRRFAEVAIRGFMAVDPWVVNRSEDKHGLYQPGNNLAVHDNEVELAQKRFVKLLERVGPMHFEFRRFREGVNWTYILDKFKLVYLTTFKPLCCIWNDVKAIVDAVCEPVSEDGERGTNPREQDLKQLLQHFQAAHSQGRPIARFLHAYPDWNEIGEEQREKRHSEKEKRKYIDSVFVMRHMLRIHMQSLFGDINTKRETCYSSAMNVAEGTNRQMLDRGYNGLVSADFERRKEYFKNRASVLMTLWDLSTAIRGRILRRILEAHCPHDEPDRAAQVERG